MAAEKIFSEKICICIDDKTKRKLRFLAKQNGQSLSVYIRFMIHRELNEGVCEEVFEGEYENEE